ncbi:MAG: hypothetical protein Sapg2KO_50340 [Saprospiraceae bacterium]
MATKKKVAPKAELNESIEQVKDSAAKASKQLTETATKVVKDIYNNGEKWVEETSQNVKETVAKVNFDNGYNAVKDIAAKANKYAAQTAEELVDGAIKSGEQWTNITSKAIKGGLKLASKQQDIVFATLENVKEQLVAGTKRTKELFK